MKHEYDEKIEQIQDKLLELAAEKRKIKDEFAAYILSSK